MDIRKYLAIPFRDHGRDWDGVDCWGLVQLVYREELGIVMPDLGDLYSDAYARGEVDATVEQAAGEAWTQTVCRGEERPYDVLVFRRGGLKTHVGLWLEPGRMLHALEGAGVVAERFDGIQWSRKLQMVLRYAG